MMEKMPSSVSRGRRRGEMMWMPEKANGCRRGDGAIEGSGAQPRFIALNSRDGAEGAVPLGPGFIAPNSRDGAESAVLLARPQSWRWSLKRRRREDSRDWTARVARA